MCIWTRRSLLLFGALATTGVGAAPDARRFRDAAFAMKDKAIASGDQAYGAVLALEGKIVGWGPSRVIADNNSDAHAERVAMWNAQNALGRKDLSGAVLYSTSIPCRDCQDYAARHGVAGMVHGSAMRNAGRPLRYSD